MTDRQLEKHLQELDQKQAEQQRFSASIETTIYNPERHRFEVTLNNGLEFSFRPDLVQEVCKLSPDELAEFRIDYRRTDLQWPEHGTGLNVLSILQGRYGTRKWMEQLNAEKGIPLGEWPDSPAEKEKAARAMGSATSTKKAKASRANGKKGGRPRKKKSKETKQKKLSELSG